MRHRLWVVLGLLSFLFWMPLLAVTAQTPLTIEGRIVQGTSDGQPLPPNLPIELHVIDTESQSVTQAFTTLTEPDYSFVFENVPRVTGNDFYVLYATYAGLRQNTPPLFADTVDFVSFPLYETTERYDDIEIISGSMQIDEFSFIQQLGVTLEVVLELQINNQGDRILYTPTAEQPASFHVELPVGAHSVAEVTPEDAPDLTHLHIETNPDTGAPVVYDTRPLVPHWPVPRTVRVTYLLRYPGEAIIDQPFDVPVLNFEVWVPRDTVYLDGDTLEIIDEERPLYAGASVYRVYRQTRSLTADEHLIFTLSGEPTETVTNTDLPSTDSSDSEDDDGLPGFLLYTLLVTLVVLSVGARWLWVRRRSQEAKLV